MKYLIRAAIIYPIFYLLGAYVGGDLLWVDAEEPLDRFGNVLFMLIPTVIIFFPFDYSQIKDAL
jgi:hypothetical protein